MTNLIKGNIITLAGRLLILYNTFVHILITLTSGFMFYIFFKYNENYAFTRFLHVFLSTLAYVPLMAEALLLMSQSNVWTPHISRSKRAWIHGGFLSSSVIISTVGISIKINSKTELGQEHFYSYHAILGLVSWILCFISVAGGILALYSPRVKDFFRPVLIKFIHTCLGLSAFILGMASLILGLDLPAFDTYTSQNEKIVITVFLSLISISCGSTVVCSAINQFKSISIVTK